MTRVTSPFSDVDCGPPTQRTASGIHSIGTRTTVSDALVAALEALGIGEAFGVVGGAVGVFAQALLGSRIRVVHFRHESGAAFAAAEAYFATGRPVLLFTTTGPGLANATNGLLSARWEGAKVVLVSGATPLRRVGRGAFQETHAQSLPADLFAAASVFDFAVTVHDPEQLAPAMARLAVGLARPSGFVAHVSLSTGVQNALAPSTPYRTAVSCLDLGVSEASAHECAQMLRSAPSVLWVGHGARHAGHLVRELAERLGAPVVCSPRAKGVFPERHPLFWGIPGFAGYGDVEARFAELRPDCLAVLGTRLSEFTAGFSPELKPRTRMLHVDVDETAIGVAYPDVPTLAIRADVGQLILAVLRHLPPAPAARLLAPVPGAELRARAGLVRPQAVMQALQTQVVEATSYPLLVDIGNAFAWAIHLLRFDEPGRFRTSTRWGSVGCAAAGVVGAALASGKPAVALVGDGAMLMQNEVSTAVRYGVPAIWVVLNDHQYGMIEQGARGAHLAPVETPIPPVDFAAMARALGADGTVVEREIDLLPALTQALVAGRPFVVDVLIDPAVLAPIGKRNASLLESIHGE